VGTAVDCSAAINAALGLSVTRAMRWPPDCAPSTRKAPVSAEHR
jgi:hypothetical protein